MTIRRPLAGYRNPRAAPVSHNPEEISSMKPVYSFAAAALLLCGCVATPGSHVARDAGGVPISLSEWTPMDIKDFAIDTLDVGIHFYAAPERRIRNNSMEQQRIRFDGGQLYVERVGRTGVYSYGTTSRLTSEENFRSAAENYYGKNKGAVVVGKIETIRKYNDRAGHVATVLQGTGQACIFGRVAFLSAGKSNPRPDERFDTYVDLGNCAGGWTPEKLAAWLRTVNIRPEVSGTAPGA